ncbi:MAG: cell division protein FtsA [Candidatus Eremiobacteraeota bacterium]|nr:cell division protein FtsA [Candidatus Eremiobacteraeota bacterium]
MAKHDIVVGLDIGTSNVRCVIGEVAPDQSIEILGKGACPSKGLKKGAVVDIDEAAKSIETAVSEAEKMAGFHINCVYVGVTGEYISSMGSHGVVTIGSSDKEINEGDIRRVIEAARLVGVPNDREIIHVIPRSFMIDGTDGVKNPVGMSGMRLEVDAHIIMGMMTFLENINKSVQRAGLEIEENGIVLGSIPTGLSVLSEEEKELGIVLVDIGGGTTDVAIFKHNSLVHTAILPIGGSNITYDIVIVLRIPQQEAERIKVSKGCASMELVKEDEQIEVISLSSVDPPSVSRMELAEVIEGRLMDIFEWLRKEIRKVTKSGIHLAGVTLTGGCAAIEGIAGVAQNALQLPVRIGRPMAVSAMMPEVMKDPAYAMAMGLVLYGSRKKSRSIERVSQSKVGDIFQKVLQWLHEVF